MRMVFEITWELGLGYVLLWGCELSQEIVFMFFQGTRKKVSSVNAGGIPLFKLQGRDAA